jgi:hypothetical protein
MPFRKQILEPGEKRTARVLGKVVRGTGMRANTGCSVTRAKTPLKLPYLAKLKVEDSRHHQNVDATYGMFQAQFARGRCLFLYPTSQI